MSVQSPMQSTHGPPRKTLWSPVIPVYSGWEQPTKVISSLISPLERARSRFELISMIKFMQCSVTIPKTANHQMTTYPKVSKSLDNATETFILDGLSTAREGLESDQMYDVWAATSSNLRTPVGIEN